MGKSDSIFQIVILVIFGLGLMIGVLFISTYQGGESLDEDLGRIVIWGTFDGRLMEKSLNTVDDNDASLADIIYIEKSKSTFNSEVLEAIAEGQAPDLLLIDDTLLNKNKKRIISIGKDFLTRETFKNTYAAGSEVYFAEDGGVYGIPMFIDPLVMYWNRDLYAAEGIPRPPETWGEFYDLSKKLTKADEDLNISQSAIAFGEAINVKNYKEILATLFMQIGNPIVSSDSSGKPLPILSGNETYPSVSSALSFFTDFSDSSRGFYSWNRSLPESDEMFLSNDLATYFGLGSEVQTLRVKNPNLNFDIAEIPRADGVKKKSVYAKFYAFVIPKAAPRPEASFRAATALSSSAYLPVFVENTRLTPARLDLISEVQDTADLSIFNREAVYAESFLDPDPEVTNGLFKSMVEYITSGRKSIKEAVEIADTELLQTFSE